MGVGFFVEESHALDDMWKIVRTMDVRRKVEKLLLEDIQPSVVSDIVGHRFGVSISSHAVNLFRDGFWDTRLLTREEMYSFMAGHLNMPVPQAMRQVYVKWIEGQDVDVDDEAMYRHIQTDAFMRYITMADDEDHEEARKYAKLAMGAAEKKRKVAPPKKRRREISNLVFDDRQIMAPSLSELHDAFSEVSGTGEDT